MYTVGQDVSVNDLWMLPVGVVLQRIASPHINPYFAATKQFRITALPNPDPVADEWRVVELQQHDMDPFWPLRHAMQEVCKADEVKLEWPDYIPSHIPKEPQFMESKNMTIWNIERITTCFLLGGVVKVRGEL